MNVLEQVVVDVEVEVTLDKDLLAPAETVPTYQLVFTVQSFGTQVFPESLWVLAQVIVQLGLPTTETVPLVHLN